MDLISAELLNASIIVVGLLVAVFIIDKAKGWFSSAPKKAKDEILMAQRIADLHTWHATRNPDGSFPWANTGALSVALERMTAILEALAKNTAQIDNRVCDMRDEMKEIRSQASRMKPRE